MNLELSNLECILQGVKASRAIYAQQLKACVENDNSELTVDVLQDLVNYHTRSISSINRAIERIKRREEL